MKETKKYISPGAWFSMEYPKSWFEFEDGEGSFLFYNPDKWDGNFRISAERGYSESFGLETLNAEVRERNLKSYSCTDFKEGKMYFGSSTFTHEDSEFKSFHWLIALKEMFFECSFTTFVDGSEAEALEVLKSIDVRGLDKKYPAEVIPVRLSEMYRINRDFEWVMDFVKSNYSVDFQGSEEDLILLDRIKDEHLIGAKKREEWQAIGITVAVIMANEIEGLEWFTLIDGNREDPILYYMPTKKVIDPMKLVWSKVKATEEFSIASSYKEAIAQLNK